MHRPFAAPGDTVRVVSTGACAPLDPQFDPDPLNNLVHLSFPSGAPDTAPVAATAVADCGADRCFAIEFVMPDTLNHGPLSGTGERVTGPATIHVTNTAACWC